MIRKVPKIPLGQADLEQMIRELDEREAEYQFNDIGPIPYALDPIDLELAKEQSDEY